MSKKTIAIIVLVLMVLIGVPTCTYSNYMTLVEDNNGLDANDAIVLLTINKMDNKLKVNGYSIKDFKDFALESLGVAIGEEGRAAQSGSFFNAVSEQYPQVPDNLWRDMTATMNAEIEDMFAAQEGRVARIETAKNHVDNPLYWFSMMFGDFRSSEDLKQAQETQILGKAAQKAKDTGEYEIPNPFGEDE